MTSIRARIFGKLPFRKALFSAMRAFGRPDFYKRLYFDGPFEIAIDDNRAFKMYQNNRYGIETELFWRGLDDAWEVASLGVWIKLCQNAEVILDIGAAEGLYALVANALRPDSVIIAFEPVPSSARELRRNVVINEAAVECFEAAVADFEGKASFIQPTSAFQRGPSGYGQYELLCRNFGGGNDGREGLSHQESGTDRSRKNRRGGC